jgi:hypothetical protein
MTLELYELSSYATGGAESWLNKFIAAALMPPMIFLGGVYRFYASELRTSKDGTLGPGQIALGVISFVLSCVIFVVVLLGILDPIMSEKCPPSSSNSTCPITQDALKSDARAVMILTLIWIGYPIVSIASRLLSQATGYDTGASYNAWISVFKDLAYACLDVSAKAGLAIYAAYRSTWL